MSRFVRTIVFRLAMIIPVVLAVASLTFLVSRVLPGDPVRVLAGPQQDEETLERFAHQPRSRQADLPTVRGLPQRPRQGRPR